jgi:hypothetical protein
VKPSQRNSPLPALSARYARPPGASGENDLVLLVRTQDAVSPRDLALNTFQTMPDVLSTQTVLILDELSEPGETS